MSRSFKLKTVSVNAPKCTHDVKALEVFCKDVKSKIYEVTDGKLTRKFSKETSAGMSGGMVSIP